MIDTQLEEFTAAEAIVAGLVEAIKDGSAKVSGTYEVTPNGTVEYNQNNFVFKDKYGALRVGNFKNQYELIRFFLFSTLEDTKEDLNDLSEKIKQVSEK